MSFEHFSNNKANDTLTHCLNWGLRTTLDVLHNADVEDRMDYETLVGTLSSNLGLEYRKLAGAFDHYSYTSSGHGYGQGESWRLQQSLHVLNSNIRDACSNLAWTKDEFRRRHALLCELRNCALMILSHGNQNSHRIAGIINSGTQSTLHDMCVVRLKEILVELKEAHLGSEPLPFDPNDISLSLCDTQNILEQIPSPEIRQDLQVVPQQVIEQVLLRLADIDGAFSDSLEWQSEMHERMKTHITDTLAQPKPAPPQHQTNGLPVSNGDAMSALKDFRDKISLEMKARHREFRSWHNILQGPICQDVFQLTCNSLDIFYTLPALKDKQRLNIVQSKLFIEQFDTYGAEIEDILKRIQFDHNHN